MGSLLLWVQRLVWRNKEESHGLQLWLEIRNEGKLVGGGSLSEERKNEDERWGARGCCQLLGKGLVVAALPSEQGSWAAGSKG